MPAGITDLDSCHAQLFTHLKKLAQSRPQPPYILEALGAGLDLPSLEEMVRSTLRYTPPRSDRWRVRYLPLLLILADSGYQYEGPSEKLWAPLEARLSTKFSYADQCALSNLYELAVEELGIAQPPQSDWAVHFRHIAWPITHAVFPLDLQSQLIHVLAFITKSVVSAQSPAELARLLGAHNTGGLSKRYGEWLRSPDLVQAIVLGLLNEGTVSWLDPTLRARIHHDIDKNLALRTKLASARQAQSALLAESGNASTTGRTRVKRKGQVLLTLSANAEGAGASQLLVELPRLSAAALRIARLRPSRFRLWGIARPDYLERLFSGVPFPVHIAALPDKETPLITSDESRGLRKPLREEVEQTFLEIRLPLIFDPATSADGWRGSSESIPQWDGTLNRRGSLYVLQKLRRPKGIGGIRFICTLANLRLLHVDLSRIQARDWLSQLLGGVRSSVGIEWVGGPHAGPPRSVQGHREDPCIWRATGSATLIAEKLTAAIPISKGALVHEREPSAATIFSLQANSESREYALLCEDLPHPPPCTVELEGPLTIQGLTQELLTLRVQGDSRLEDLPLRVTIEDPSTDSTLARTELSLSRLPETFGATFWRELLSEELLSSLSSKEEVFLRVDLNGLTRREWRLEQEVFEYQWSDDLERPEPFDEDGPLPVLEATGLHPIELKVPTKDSPSRVVVLRTSKRHANGYTSGRCGGQTQGALSWKGPQQPVLSKSLRSTKTGEAGLLDLLEALLSWRLAASTHALAELRRKQVVKAIEDWTITTCCGPDWLSAEERSLKNGPHGPWQALVRACRLLSTKDDCIGYDGIVTTIGAVEEGYLDNAIECNLRRAFPHLSAALSPTSTRVSSQLAENLDEAFNQGYRDFSRHLAQLAPEGLEERDLLSDAQTGPDDWMRAFELARQKLEIPQLVELLWPRGRAYQLAELDYGICSVEDLAETLSFWSKDHRQAHGGRVWPTALTHSVLQLWVSPPSATRVDLRLVANQLLANRGMSRACRYVALRSRLARSEDC